uniref:Uncharacterized protein n=1 Tax=Parascaris univalens TaxID=6257 RepID=A0A915CI03_PARUN
MVTTSSDERRKQKSSSRFYRTGKFEIGHSIKSHSS